MLFIAYSKNDRQKLVEPILFNLKQFGIEVWYDFYDMFLGDNRKYANFDTGIASCDYALFIITSNFFNSPCAIEELTYVKALYENNKIIIFPVFYNISPCTIPKEHQWITNIIYNEITDKTGTLYVTQQIIERLLYDKLKKYENNTIEKLQQNDKLCNTFINTSINLIDSIIENNYMLKIGVLYALYTHIIQTCEPLNIPSNIHKVISKTIEIAKVNGEINHLSYSIFEKSVIITINSFLDMQTRND